MAYSEDHIVLAAEYALGTLDADERAQVETMMSVDRYFAAMVQAWEYRLGVLNQMVGSVEPPPELWGRIKTAAGLSKPQASLPHSEVLLPMPPVESEIVAPATIADSSDLIRLAVRRWRNVAALTTAIAAALVVMIGVGIYKPDLLPEGIRPKLQTKVVEVKTLPALTPQSAQYVAIFQKEGGELAFILTVDGATKNLTLRNVGASTEAGKSFELWLISDKLPRPRSLGVIGAGDFTSRPALASYDTNIINNATYAVTIEQVGGSPDGNPHSEPVYSGKLVETVPPAVPSSAL